ncbi:hypothetical protein AX15_004385 [Amanita polypyramis BW_CC]|nr:hypothetical protein AX15_004385 [Amanita polypyramis BW_CC]
MLRYINLYNPRLHSFYHNPVNNGYGRYPNYQDPEWERERAEDRHAQYLHEDADSDEDYLFRPCEKAYFDSWRKQEAIINERRRREAEAQMEEARQREEKRRHIEEARKRQAAEIERNRREHMQHAQHTPSRTPPADHVSIRSLPSGVRALTNDHSVTLLTQYCHLPPTESRHRSRQLQLLSTPRFIMTQQAKYSDDTVNSAHYALLTILLLNLRKHVKDLYCLNPSTFLLPLKLLYHPWMTRSLPSNLCQTHPKETKTSLLMSVSTATARQ